ncbi:hypothetical protein JJQ72_09315 [Paenibacillus sp. F411]|uniref:hypothetical protein n=1 Tax=Paenibacillus sp. F411 TaxID=2820239 RepID=UPI001AAFF8C3|nr:hypothetical protein [Paenibacillus sp. F411]MBO2944164.1 hypothetical protein [Paenibacillus sp. F411]
MMKSWGKAAAAGLLAFGIAGCSQDVVEREVEQYNGQAFEEGTQEAAQEGRGLNGKFLTMMKERFQDEGMELTKESFTEAQDGSIQYQYLIKDAEDQQIKLFVYPDEETRMAQMKELYGGAVEEGGEGLDAVLVEEKSSAFVYLSSGENQGQYEEQIKRIASELLKSNELHAGDHTNESDDNK